MDQCYEPKAMSKQSCTQCHDKYWPQMTGTLFFGMHVSYDLFSFWKRSVLAMGISWGTEVLDLFILSEF